MGELMKMTLPLMMLVSLALTGCPESRTPVENGQTPTSGAATAAPAPTTAAPDPTPAAALAGGWSVHVTSQDPSKTGKSPDEKAQVFFDHYAEVRDGKLWVEHKTLSKTFPLADEQQAVTLDGVMTSTDWKKMKLRLSLEGAVAGGAIYTVIVTRDGDTIELQTGNLDAYPALKTVVTTLQAVTKLPSP